jgi:hypothetical protein
VRVARHPLRYSLPHVTHLTRVFGTRGIARSSGIVAALFLPRRFALKDVPLQTGHRPSSETSENVGWRAPFGGLSGPARGNGFRGGGLSRRFVTSRFRDERVADSPIPAKMTSVMRSAASSTLTAQSKPLVPPQHSRNAVAGLLLQWRGSSESRQDSTISRRETAASRASQEGPRRYPASSSSTRVQIRFSGSSACISSGSRS